jgi:hypothetical protein
MQHLKDAKMTYSQHFWHSLSSGIALIIHAFLPFLLKDYASNKICKK